MRPRRGAVVLALAALLGVHADPDRDAPRLELRFANEALAYEIERICETHSSRQGGPHEHCRTVLKKPAPAKEKKEPPAKKPADDRDRPAKR